MSKDTTQDTQNITEQINKLNGYMADYIKYSYATIDSARVLTDGLTVCENSPYNDVQKDISKTLTAMRLDLENIELFAKTENAVNGFKQDFEKHNSQLFDLYRKLKDLIEGLELEKAGLENIMNEMSANYFEIAMYKQRGHNSKEN